MKAMFSSDGIRQPAYEHPMRDLLSIEAMTSANAQLLDRLLDRIEAERQTDMNQVTPIVEHKDTDLSVRAPVHRAEDLTAGGQTARIILGNQVYQLRITKLGKLILTK